MKSKVRTKKNKVVFLNAGKPTKKHTAGLNRNRIKQQAERQWQYRIKKNKRGGNEVWIMGKGGGENFFNSSIQQGTILNLVLSSFALSVESDLSLL